MASLLAATAAWLVGCRVTSQKMDLSRDMIATPAHRMAQSEYPFDSDGRYVDAWAAQGTMRYGRVVNTDDSDDGRDRQAAPERRPLPTPRETASTRPPAPPERPVAAGSRPPSVPRTSGGSSTKTGTATQKSPKPSATTAQPSTKPPAKKPPVKKKATTHTVKRGDSLSSLSRRYGVSVQALKKANNMKSDRIIDGRKLVIPKN